MTVDYRAASKFVREYTRKQNSNWYVFNDRLKSGGRSIKVQGTTKKFYQPIKRKLEQMGYKVTLVNLGTKWGHQAHYRIHVI